MAMNNTKFPYRVTIEQNVVKQPYLRTPFKTLRAAESYIKAQAKKITFSDAMLECINKKTGKWGLIGSMRSVEPQTEG